METGETRNEQGQFIPGVSGNPAGRPPETPEQKIAKRAIKELVEEYKETLAQSLPAIAPVLVEKALSGDVPAIREFHDRVMNKAPQDITSGGEKLFPKPIADVSANESIQENTQPNQTP